MNENRDVTPIAPMKAFSTGDTDEIYDRKDARNLPINLKMVIVKLNPIIVGWGNYFKIANVNWLYKGLDSWTRMRLRAFKEKKKSYLSNTRIRNDFLENQGLKSLSTLLNPEW